MFLKNRTNRHIAINVNALEYLSIAAQQCIDIKDMAIIKKIEPFIHLHNGDVTLSVLDPDLVFNAPPPPAPVTPPVEVQPAAPAPVQEEVTEQPVGEIIITEKELIEGLDGEQEEFTPFESEAELMTQMLDNLDALHEDDKKSDVVSVEEFNTMLEKGEIELGLPPAKTPVKPKPPANKSKGKPPSKRK